MYINYYSKQIYKVGMTEEQFNRINKNNAGRIVTKEVDAFRVGYATNNDKRIRSIADKLQKILAMYTPPQDMTTQYHTFKIPKASGGKRTITAPNPELKAAQTAIASMINKQYSFLPHNAAHGFVKNRNCVTALKVHQANKSRWFLKIDIHDFFNNITIRDITLGIDAIGNFDTQSKQTLLTVIQDVCMLSGGLPQGSPASPVLANIAMFLPDIAITEWCDEHNLVYTRYADDILISSRESFSRCTTVAAVRTVLKNLLTHTTISARKTRYGSYNGSNWNLGLMYNNQDNITVGYKNKQKLRALIHNAYRDDNKETLVQLAGKLSYYRFIEPEYFNRQIEYFKTKGYTELLSLVGVCEV